jgi:hypothetical protein
MLIKATPLIISLLDCLVSLLSQINSITWPCFIKGYDFTPLPVRMLIKETSHSLIFFDLFAGIITILHQE